MIEISPQGEVDVDDAYRIRDVVDSVLLRPPALIRIDLRHVTLIDSVGIGVLVACYHAAAASGVPLTVTNPTLMVYRQLWVAGLVGLLGRPTPVPASPAGTAEWPDR